MTRLLMLLSVAFLGLAPVAQGMTRRGVERAAPARAVRPLTDRVRSAAAAVILGAGLLGPVASGHAQEAAHGDAIRAPTAMEERVVAALGRFSGIDAADVEIDKLHVSEGGAFVGFMPIASARTHTIRVMPVYGRIDPLSGALRSLHIMLPENGRGA